jgi:ankyrin repeat protein
MIACKAGLTRVCNVIVTEGADVNIQDDSGKTALLHASRDGYDHICAIIINAHNVNVDIQDKNMRTAVMEASIEGYSNICHMLIDAGANLELRDKNGKRACDLACGKALKSYISKSTNWKRQRYFIMFLYQSTYLRLSCAENRVVGIGVPDNDRISSPQSVDHVFYNADLCREIASWL